MSIEVSKDAYEDDEMDELLGLERLHPDMLVDLIITNGETITRLEKTMSLASDVLDGYGTSVEEVLTERLKQNDQT
jgi:hypothetical protein